MTPMQARSLVRKHAQAAWLAALGATVVLSWPNVTKGGQDVSGPHGVGYFRDVTGGQVSMGARGDNKHRYSALMFISARYPKGGSEEPATQAAWSIVSAFRDPPAGICIDQNYARVDGEVDGMFQVTAVVGFRFEDHG